MSRFKVKVVPNPDREKRNSVLQSLKKTGGQCPCVSPSAWDASTKCPCVDVREHGECICGLYVKADEANKPQHDKHMANGLSSFKFGS